MCKHEQSMLVGGAAGITCRACGKTFPTWAALLEEKHPAPAQKTPEAETVTQAQEAPAKGKRGRTKKTVQE